MPFRDVLSIPHKRYRRRTMQLFEKLLRDKGLEEPLRAPIAAALHEISLEEDQAEQDNYNEIERWGTRAVSGTTGIPILVAASNASNIEKTAATFVCSGTDDQTEINQAIGLLGDLGGIIQLSTGTFVVSDSINLVHGVTIRGMGSQEVGGNAATVIAPNTASITVFASTEDDADLCSFYDFSLDWSVSTSGSSIGWDCVGNYRWRWQNIFLSMTAGDGYGIYLRENPDDPYVEGCQFVGGDFQIYCSAAGAGPIDYLTLIGNQFGNCNRNVYGSFRHSLFVGNKFDGPRGIVFTAGAGATPVYNMIVGNQFRNNQYGIEQMANQSLIAANYFAGSPTSHFIYIAEDEVSIIGNYFLSSGAAATGIEINSTSSDCAVIGNDQFGTFTSAFFTDGGTNTRTTPTPAPAPASHNHAGEDITSGTVADARIASTIARDSEVTAAIAAHVADADAHHNQQHALDGSDHTVSGLTTGHVLTALSATTFGFQAPAAASADTLVDVILFGGP